MNWFGVMKRAAGALLYDWPRYRRAMRSGHWELMHNRDERISTDGRGVRCEWRFTTDLHIAKVFPSLGAKLMNAAFAQWPVAERDAPETRGAAPQVSFVIGHRGLDRLPHLRATLRSIAGQRDAAIECIVVEQGALPEIETQLPPWVHYVFTECATAYNRAAAFNAGVAAARSAIVVLHDNDIVVPADYVREVAARAAEGWQFIDIKRFLFHLDANGALSSIMQNAQGGSIAATRAAYDAIGGFDEEFVGWGGEDNDFWDRAATTGRVYDYGYLPMKHLYHPPQQGKWSAEAPGVKRYQELERVPAEERIARLLRRR